MKSMSIKFYSKPNKKELSKFTIYARVLFDRTKAEFSTGIKCNNDDWDETKERFKRSSLLNQKIAEVQEKIYRAKNDLDSANRYYFASDIKSLVLGDKKIKILLTDYYQEYIQNKIDEERSTNSTIQKYKQTYSYLFNFLKAENLLKTRVNEIDNRFVCEFNDFLSKTSWNEFGEKLTTVTINKHHSRFKAVANDAYKRGHIKLNPYANFKLSFPHSKREYLSKDEILKISLLDLSNNDGLDKTRDIFLFSCFTGLRYMDAIQLTMDNIIEINSNQYLQIIQRKTGEPREIPLLDAAQTIIEKYSFCKERIVKDLVLPTLSNQKINQYLKLIANLSGIRKTLTHHIARHTCATTVLLDNDIPLETVSHWLGHNSVRTTQIYAKISHYNLDKHVIRINNLINT